MDKAEGKIPPNQMCIGELGDWTDCSKECGRGKKTRRFNERQKAGETGIPCIYENGQMESTECFERLCKFSEECEYDKDCISGLCSENENICTYPHMCTRSKIYNCNSEQCSELNRKYGEYSYSFDTHRCENKAIITKLEEIEINEETEDILGRTDDERKVAEEGIKFQNDKDEFNRQCDLLDGKKVIESGKCLVPAKNRIECENSYEVDSPDTNKRHPCIYMGNSCQSLKEKEVINIVFKSEKYKRDEPYQGCRPAADESSDPSNNR